MDRDARPVPMPAIDAINCLTLSHSPWGPSLPLRIVVLGASSRSLAYLGSRPISVRSPQLSKMVKAVDKLRIIVSGPLRFLWLAVP